MELLTLAKAELKRSENETDHPFRYFYLGTIGQYPEVRTVVKRDLDDRLAVTFFTDSRTRKVSQIEDDNRVSALFYHPGHRLQIRMTGSAMKLKEDSLAYAAYYQQVNEYQDSLTVPGYYPSEFQPQLSGALASQQAVVGGSVDFARSAGIEVSQAGFSMMLGLFNQQG